MTCLVFNCCKDRVEHFDIKRLFLHVLRSITTVNAQPTVSLDQVMFGGSATTTWDLPWDRLLYGIPSTNHMIVPLPCLSVFPTTHYLWPYLPKLHGFCLLIRRYLLLSGRKHEAGMLRLEIWAKKKGPLRLLRGV